MLCGMTQVTDTANGKSTDGKRRPISSKFYESRHIGVRARVSYDRTRDLPALVALWPSELLDFTPPGTQKIISRIRLALRAERVRGRSGHWTYDLQRHLALVRAYKAERSSLPQETSGKNSD